MGTLKVNGRIQALMPEGSEGIMQLIRTGSSIGESSITFWQGGINNTENVWGIGGGMHASGRVFTICSGIAKKNLLTMEPDTGDTWFNGSISSDGTITATSFIGDLSGNAATATKLKTSRTINGTSFNGSKNITTAKWGTARTITIGNGISKTVDGSGDVSWTLDEVTNCGNIWVNGISIGPTGVPSMGQSHGGYIDFHFNSNSSNKVGDYTSRMIEEEIDGVRGIDFRTANLFHNTINFTEKYGNGTKMKVLWTNTSGNFAAQTVSVNLSGYDYILITGFVSWDSTSPMLYGIVRNTTNQSAYLSTFGIDYWMHARQFFIRSNGVEFTSGYMRDSSNGNVYANWDGRSVPYQIIGIKIGS